MTKLDYYSGFSILSLGLTLFLPFVIPHHEQCVKYPVHISHLLMSERRWIIQIILISFRKSTHFIRKSTLFSKALTPKKNATFGGMEGFVKSVTK